MRPQTQKVIPLPTRRAPDQGCPAQRRRIRPRSQYHSNDLPLAVWACAQTTSQWQRHRRYLPESHRHPAKMLPALARQAIEAYSEPSDLILDPMCGIGTTLVEAIHTGRRAVGIELEPRWTKLARANIEHAHHQGASHPACVIEGDARRTPLLLPQEHQPVDLIITSPPYACQIADLAAENLKRGAGSLRREDTTNYSPNRGNLGHARGGAYLAAMAEVYAACAAVLKPGGFLVLVTKDMRSDGALRNLSGETIRLCQDAGLRYWQRIVGLLATLRENELVMRPSIWQVLNVRRARSLGERTHVVAHEDVLVFRKPDATTHASRKAA